MIPVHSLTPFKYNRYGNNDHNGNNRRRGGGRGRRKRRKRRRRRRRQWEEEEKDKEQQVVKQNIGRHREQEILQIINAKGNPYLSSGAPESGVAGVSRHTALSPRP